jgi:formamidopyrimidine-DNA glycosylase
MPELAEVEYYRKRWDPGLGQRITRVHLHPEKRVFRGTNADAVKRLCGKKFDSSEAAAKQMLFRFGKDSFLGIHLGMTGKLSVGPADYAPTKHDHLVLFQKKRALIYTDARQFGRVLVHEGTDLPEWWSTIGSAVTSKEFTIERMNAFLERRARLPIKGALLVQKGFPGIGNWMADEILWRAGIAPAKLCASLTTPESKKLWREVRYVARVALEKIGTDFGDPPSNWLFHQRWAREGACPKHKTKLRREEIAGRTTAWCPKCQQ